MPEGTDSASFHETVRVVKFNDGLVRSRRKADEEILSGANRSKDGSWKHRYQRIDRASDWYDKAVTDPRTGASIHRCSEPLSQHRGRGDAKRKS
jgi:hypothetical protein